MKVLIDGKEVVCHNDVKVIYEDLVTFGEDAETEYVDLHLTLTHEGEITDVLLKGEIDPFATQSETAQEIADNMI